MPRWVRKGDMLWGGWLGQVSLVIWLAINGLLVKGALRFKII